MDYLRGARRGRLWGLGSQSPGPAERSVFWPKISSQIPWLPGWCFQPIIQTRCYQLSGPIPPGQRPRGSWLREAGLSQGGSTRCTHARTHASTHTTRTQDLRLGLVVGAGGWVHTPPRMRGCPAPTYWWVGGAWGGQLPYQLHSPWSACCTPGLCLLLSSCSDRFSVPGVTCVAVIINYYLMPRAKLIAFSQ